jgi:DNA-binding CsgD family transcriptional regulator
MKDISDLFWDASVAELKQGYVYDQDAGIYRCLICGQSFEKGIIYSDGDTFFEAERYTQHHIHKQHGSMFTYLLGLDKKLTGLTDLQKKVLDYFFQGLTDKEIVQELGGGSTSTIRHHRFTLREKMKQAKVFLALMELTEEHAAKPTKWINPPRQAKIVDQRFDITETEQRQILEKYFPEGLEGPLAEFPKKEKRKVAILKHLITRFQANRKYSELEVNRILEHIYPDYVTLRRYLIEYGFMDRTPDGSQYWIL